MRQWLLEWFFPLVIIPTFIYAVVTTPFIRIFVVIAFAGLMAYVLYRITSKQQSNVAPSMFLYTGSGKSRRIHFRPVKQRPTLTPSERRRFKAQVNQFRQAGVKKIFAQTIIDRRQVEFIGFRRVAPSSPFTYLVTLIMTVLRTGSLQKNQRHYCWLYVYDI